MTQDKTPFLTAVRILVADDHPLVRRGVVQELSRHSDVTVVGEATDGDQAIALVEHHVPDVLVIDFRMPGLPSLDVIQHLQTLPCVPRILVLTAYSEHECILSLLRAGANGYILKSEEPSTLITAVRTVVAGKRWISPAIMAELIQYTVDVQDQPTESALSARERDVLDQLATGKDNRGIGVALHISERTVRFHLRNIYDKLGVRRGEAIAWSVRKNINQREVGGSYS